MKEKSSSQKTSQHGSSDSQQAPSAGPEGAVIAPPAYEMDVLDQPGSFAAIQRKTAPAAGGGTPGGRPVNRIGLPDGLKSGVESLSGLSLDDVRVYYNSSRPAQLQALAYTQGADIHVAPGQERHLPHEAWHVVQQKQGRVKATTQMKGAQINDNHMLEKEADLMGARVAGESSIIQRTLTPNSIPAIIQRKIRVGSDSYSSQTENMGELKEILKLEGEFTKLKLSEKGVSIGQVLTRFDFQNRKFDSVRTLVVAIRNELKSDLGKDDKEIDELVLDHPLARDENTILSPVLRLLKEKDPNGTIRNLILEDTETAKEVMELYRKSSEHGESDSILFKSILATIELQNSGAIYRQEFTEKESELLNYATYAYQSDVVEKMVKDYGLDKYEHNSIIAYSFPNKDKIFVGNELNPYYMGYSKSNWGKYKDGWTALASAMKKLPSLGKLRLNITTYRASRNSEESESLENLEIGTPILHGKHILGQEQQHYTSTALTYNVHNTPSRIQKAKGLMAISGTSGVLINPFGGQGFLDGAEILFPPHMVSKLAQKAKGAYRDKDFEAPIYHLQEVTPPVERSKVVDDFKFEKLKSEYLEGQERYNERVKTLIDQIQQFNKILTGGNERKLTLGEQTEEKLRKTKEELFDCIETHQDDPTVQENYKKLVLIDKINAKYPKLTFKKRNELDIVKWGKPLWKHDSSELAELARKFEAD